MNAADITNTNLKWDVLKTGFYGLQPIRSPTDL